MSSGNPILSGIALADAEGPGGAGGACASPPLERQIARLDRLAEAGMEIVEALVAQAKGTGSKVVDGDVALAFSRVSRAVRMAALLHRELTQAPADPADPAGQVQAAHRKAQVDRTVRIVQRVARDHCGHEGFALGAYGHEARERLDNDDIYGLVATRPIGELVAMICEDLGLEPNWEHLAAEAWAQAEIESGAKGSPFVDKEAWPDEDDRGTPRIPPSRNRSPRARPSSLSRSRTPAAPRPPIPPSWRWPPGATAGDPAVLRPF